MVRDSQVWGVLGHLPTLGGVLSALDRRNHSHAPDQNPRYPDTDKMFVHSITRDASHFGAHSGVRAAKTTAFSARLSHLSCCLTGRAATSPWWEKFKTSRRREVVNCLQTKPASAAAQRRTRLVIAARTTDEAAAVSSPRHVLPKDLPNAIKQLAAAAN